MSLEALKKVFEVSSAFSKDSKGIYPSKFLGKTPGLGINMVICPDFTTSVATHMGFFVQRPTQREFTFSKLPGFVMVESLSMIFQRNLAATPKMQPEKVGF